MKSNGSMQRNSTNGSKRSGRERASSNGFSLHPKHFVFFDKRTGTRRFEVQADECGRMPMDQAVSLLAVHCVARQQMPRDFSVMVDVGEDLVDALVGRAIKLIQSCSVSKAPVPLSQRQRQVLSGIAQSLTNKEIAAKLNVSERTVKFHVSALLEKFDVRRRVDLMLEALDVLSLPKAHKRDGKPQALLPDPGAGALALSSPKVSLPLLTRVEKKVRQVTSLKGQTPSGASPPERERDMQKRALIVDDEASTCEFIEKILTTVGIESLSLTRSAEAPDILRQGKFAVVFLDYQMASPDGPELTRQMRDSGYHRMTPVILISDDQRPDAISKGFQAGASFFLYKPIDKDRLLRLVRATQGAMEQERRRTRRVPLKSRVQLRFRGQEIEGETVDVSMDGVLVKARRTLPIGSSVDVSLHLPKASGPIVGVGSVVRFHNRDEMGIHLGRLPLRESQKLQEFLLPLIPAE